MEKIPIEFLRCEAVLFGQGPAPTAENKLQPPGPVRIQLWRPPLFYKTMMQFAEPYRADCSHGLEAVRQVKSGTLGAAGLRQSMKGIRQQFGNSRRFVKSTDDMAEISGANRAHSNIPRSKSDLVKYAKASAA
jgi:hypothetical protein